MRPTVAIVGTGVAGIGMALELARHGHRDFTLFERAGRLGGTWRDNTYPGAACDIPSHLYSFSFEPNPRWSHRFSPQREILSYLERCATKHDLYRHVRFGAEIEAARFDPLEGRWSIRTASGDVHEADVLVTGCGQLSRPRVPDLPGRADFRGVVFHSARWDHRAELAGKRVAVVGTGASAVQFIPELAKTASRLTVVQRTPNWIVPRRDHAYARAQQWAFSRVPSWQRLHRIWIWGVLEAHFFGFEPGSLVGRYVTWVATRHLRTQIADESLRKKLLPSYPIGCKRVLISDDFYPALARPNVELVEGGVERFSARGIVASGGREIEADAIVFATGFDTTRFLSPMRIEGPDGATLEARWRAGAEAYLGITVAGFPNLFMLYGPNTNLGHNSIIFMIECQTRYVRACLEEMSRRGARSLEVRPEAMASYNAGLQRALGRTVWASACTSWYKNEAGRITNNWSGLTAAYWRRTLRPDFGDYVVVPG